MAVSFICGGNRSTRRKPSTCRKPQTNVNHIVLCRVHLAMSVSTRRILGIICQPLYIAVVIWYQFCSLSWRKSFYNVIFNNISVISWRSVLLMDDTGIPEKTTYYKKYNKVFLLCFVYLFVCSVVFNATFNNISVISWQSVEETGEPGENHRHVTSHWQTLSNNVVHLTLIEIRTHNISGDSTDCTCSC